jgi:hypothetical protein
MDISKLLEYFSKDTIVPENAELLSARVSKEYNEECNKEFKKTARNDKRIKFERNTNRCLNNY